MADPNGAGIWQDGEDRDRGALVEAIRRSGLSQQQLAARSGVSVATIRSLQQGRTRSFRPDTLDRLAAALGPARTAARRDGATPPGRASADATAARERRIARLSTRLMLLHDHELRGVERLVDELSRGHSPRG